MPHDDISENFQILLYHFAFVVGQVKQVVNIFVYLGFKRVMSLLSTRAVAVKRAERLAYAVVKDARNRMARLVTRERSGARK